MSSTSSGAAAFVAVVVLLIAVGCTMQGANQNNKFKGKVQKRSIVSLIFSNKTIQDTKNMEADCTWLKGYGYHQKQCRNRTGFTEVLRQARLLAVSYCEREFRFDRWNCSFDKRMFNKVYRETAFMYAISASALLYATSKACGKGKLSGCSCPPLPTQPKATTWKWGGCGENIKQAKKIATRFLKIRQGKDGPAAILNFNTNIGFKTTREQTRRACTCHGLSGSCTLKTCYKMIEGRFDLIAESLKRHYHSAKIVGISNKIQNDSTSYKQHKSLIYLARSPNFCEATVGRHCLDLVNCATLCCGRGYITEIVEVEEKCNCVFINKIMNVTCSTCKNKKDLYICK